MYEYQAKTLLRNKNLACKGLRPLSPTTKGMYELSKILQEVYYLVNYLLYFKIVFFFKLNEKRCTYSPCKKQ